MYTIAKRAVKAVVPEQTWRRFYARHYWTIQPLTVDFCPVALPWFARQPALPIMSLHRIATRPLSMDEPRVGERVVRAIACLVWPFRLLSSMGEELLRHGRAVRQLHGVGRLAQLGGMLRLAVTCNIAPVSFYRFRLFDPRNARRARQYLQADELDALHDALARRLPSLEPLDDKELFFQHGRATGLPVVPVIASFDTGGTERWFGPEGLPASDLILKPAHELCGRGVQRWNWSAGQQSWVNHDRVLDAAALLELCRRAGRHQKHVLQAVVRNHPALAPLAPAGLATLRVVTYRRLSGESGVIMAGLRMPTAGQCVDNFAAGGIGAPLDAAGVLRAAVAKDPGRGTFSRHPDSGARIEGTAVPYHADAKDLALRAHAVFPWVPTVGWDVVIAPEGPCLLEANPSWCYELAQIVAETPLGETPYASVFLEHLAAQARCTAGLGAGPGTVS